MGFDHGVGHPLLLLCNEKAHNCRKNKSLDGLWHYFEWPKVADAVVEAQNLYYSVRSNGIQRSKQGPIHTIPPGKSTSNNALASRWRPTSLGKGSCSSSGRNKGASVPSATNRSPRSSDGTVITSSGERKAVKTAWTISSSSTPTVTGRCITEV